ncbi:hypothetical protein AC579_5331 [Pseudocercospora musae]|uniref:Uncharacterized protein n=1 Tax=Pseudocercospora musae TaxID=113226 RepID=A0A139ISR1_9PEZI|nr:hypothetical protein AC579_5331 [Pseudocercospora musae]
MESQQEREQPKQVQRQQQHEALNDNADFNANAAASAAQQRSSSFYGSTTEGCQGPASKATVNTISTHQANAQPNHAGNGAMPTQVPSANPSSIAGKKKACDNNPMILDPQSCKARSFERKQEQQQQPGLDVALSYNASVEQVQQHDVPDVGTTNDQAVADARSNKDGSQLHMQQPPAGQNAPDLSGSTQASMVQPHQQDTPYPKLPPDLARMAQKLIPDKGWSYQKVWHWYYNGMPVEEAPGVANDPPVTPAPLEMLESQGIYEFFDWNHYYQRRRDENFDPRQCKTVQFSGMDVQVMLLTGNDAGEEGSKILLDHIVSARKEFANLAHLSFAECVFGSPTEASHGIKELFRTRFAYACQLTCTSAFVWSLSFNATDPGSKGGDQELRTPNFKVSITHFRAKKAFDEERAKLRLKHREFGVERVKRRLCRDVVDDMGDIRHKFEDSNDFIRLMELRHVLACLSIQSTLERHIDDDKRNHEETGLIQPEPWEGWTSANGCYSRVSLACMTVRRRNEIRQLLLRMPTDYHLLNINVSKCSERGRRVFTEMMTFAETEFPRLFFTDDLRKKYGNPWTVTEATEDKEPMTVAERTHSVVPGDRQSAMHAPQSSSGDEDALTASSNENGQDNDRSRKRRSPTEGQSDKRRRTDEALLTRLPQRRRQVGQKAILPKQAKSQPPLLSTSDLNSFQEVAYNCHLAATQPPLPSESIQGAAHNSHLAEAPGDSPRVLNSHPQLISAVGWPQYEGQSFKSVDQLADHNSPDNYITATQFVAGARSVLPNSKPQPYSSSYRPSEYVMGWQQPAGQTYNAANQLESQCGFQNYSLPNDSLQSYGSSYSQPDPAVDWHQQDDLASYNAAAQMGKPYGSPVDLPAEDYRRLAEDDEEIAYNLPQMVPSDDTRLNS